MKQLHKSDKPIAEEDLLIRWLIRNDFERVLELENQNFEFPWSEEDLLSCLKMARVIGMVIEYHHEVIGYMIYELNKDHITLLNIAVESDFQRQSVGSQLLKRLMKKLSFSKRGRMTVTVRESNLPAQMFFSAHDFRATSILKKSYEENDEDAYVMQYNEPFTRVSQ
jgi:[ribosomal protein S18]-alanine N-acetyltransferase